MAVTKKRTSLFLPYIFNSISFILLLLMNLSVWAAVLPEDRADLMFHQYEGGGVTINGPSLLVRKNIADTVSFSGNYYVDSIVSASIDVMASGASEYTEERTEYSIGADYLVSKNILSAGMTTSEENDYSAETIYFSASHDMFGDLTTVSIGYAAGSDIIRQTGNDAFEENADRQNYRLNISQILTPTLIAGFSYEGITDEGYLNNPYRSYRYRSPLDPENAYLTAQELYPSTRTSDAFALRFQYYLPYRAALRGEYRHFTDDWDIKADTYLLRYSHPFMGNWLADFTLRHYQQSAAYFYADLFDFESQNDKDFRARDKEMGDYTNSTIGFGLTYELPKFSNAIDKSIISLEVDYIMFDYDDFRDLTDLNSAVGEEELYSFDATVIKLFFSLWY